jgi:hypothetical protein
MLNLNVETVRFVIDKAHQFQMLGEAAADDSIDGGIPPTRSSKRRSMISSPTSRLAWSV